MWYDAERVKALTVSFYWYGRNKIKKHLKEQKSTIFSKKNLFSFLSEFASQHCQRKFWILSRKCVNSCFWPNTNLTFERVLRHSVSCDLNHCQLSSYILTSRIATLFHSAYHTENTTVFRDGCQGVQRHSWSKRQQIRMSHSSCRGTRAVLLKRPLNFNCDSRLHTISE